MEYSFISLIVSVLSILLAMLIYKYKGYVSIYFTSLILFVEAIFLILTFFWLGCYYITGEGVNDAVIYTITRSLYGADISGFVLPVVISILLICIFLFVSGKLFITTQLQRKKMRCWSMLSMLMAVLSIGVSPALSQLLTYNKPPEEVDGSDFQRYYITPHNKIDNPNFNLVYIYGESLERTFFDENTFPELLPELTLLKNNAVDFSGTEQYPATDFTIAGIVASQCGLPLFAPTDLSGKKASQGFFSSSICLGDILKNSGYETWFMQGANLRFADKDIFFKTHGIDHAWGLVESGLDKNFAVQNGWGLYDDILLDKVWQKFEDLSKKEKPFALFTLTLDTHPPKGFIPSSCSMRYEKDGQEVSALSAVLCSQKEVAKFIKRIQSSPWAKNTIIVLSSDHLLMQNITVSVDFLNKMTRRDLFVIFKDGLAPGIIADKRSTLDNGATVLELMGGGNAIGLGRSSLSQPSLASKFDNFKNKLLAWGPSIRSLWGNPEYIKAFSIDLNKNALQFDHYTYSLPLLLKVTPEEVLPIIDRGNESFMSLRRTLGFLPEGQKFIWVDQCMKMEPVWQPDAFITKGWCVAMGKAGKTTRIEKIKNGSYSGVLEEFSGITDHQRYQQIQSRLLLASENMRYQSDRLMFAAEGLPVFIKSITGLSHPELWGRWSDAFLSPDVAITFNHPLPEAFKVELTGKAYGKNIGQPVLIKVGAYAQNFTLKGENQTVILDMINAEKGDTITITPPHPEMSNEDNNVGPHISAPARKLGIGLAELRIIPVKP
ncbi:phosphatidylglycerol--membrane-oligosaccharide glycerophosphotransferase [Salmonella enterica subsp. salamae]|uniref:Phosphatidylglycerol--membrane-oligosaccharide glycerophosphotransferase n=1 Tax=Salmonella enterica subsp. salamae TaxID=59202 RepID=A0A5Y3X925_SALER|nr:phosphatidylglycerol--membrane-oligosaccharide glycerophosphotransferase [Salmonella enterica subsp. salamae]HCL5283791.1 phosphatidylglycerol--membrane-oligosaccharide glycerophosphotransferase [Salmonella enterica]